MRFLTLKQKAFGLDISDLSVRVANLKKRGRFFKLVSWGKEEIPPGAIVDGEIKNQEVVIKAIKNCLKKARGKRIKERKVVLSLPENKAFFEIIKMPRMTEEELKQAVAFEIENYIPLSLEDIYFDSEIIPFNGGYFKEHSNVLVSAIPKKIVDSYVSCLKKAGFLPTVLEVESQAISRALIKNGLSPGTVLIIDFGISRASFIIFSGRSILFTSSIPVNCFMLTASIAKALKIGIVQAEKLKIDYGLSGLFKLKKNFKDREETIKKKIAEAMIPILSDLSEQIKKHLDYYQTHVSENKLLVSGNKIEKVILSGRGANLKGLIDFLSLELSIPVELGNPWINIMPKISKELPPLPFSESLGYSTALGLAIRGAKE